MRFTTKEPTVEGERRVTLHLHNHGDGSVSVVAVDDLGDDWYLGSFETDGYFHLTSGVPDNLGICVDDTGQIEIMKE